MNDKFHRNYLKVLKSCLIFVSTEKVDVIAVWWKFFLILISCYLYYIIHPWFKISTEPAPPFSMFLNPPLIWVLVSIHCGYSLSSGYSWLSKWLLWADIESWPGWDSNPRLLNPVLTLQLIEFSGHEFESDSQPIIYYNSISLLLSVYKNRHLPPKDENLDLVGEYYFFDKERHVKQKRKNYIMDVIFDYATRGGHV